MTTIEKIKKYIQKNTLRALLLLVVALLFLYLFSVDFRCFLEKSNIDPNFIIGFFTVIALILSIIQNMHDRRLTYNMRLISSIEEKGLSIIGKLLTIRQKSEIFLITLKQIKKAIVEKQIYRDSNNTFSKEDINKDLEMVTAFIQTYFLEESSEWNKLQEDKLNKLATYCNDVSLNYNENIELILKEEQFTNTSLDNIDTTIEESELLYKEIDQMAFEMSNRIIEKINDSFGKVKDSFDFKL